MSDWHETRLGKLVDFQSGGTLSNENPAFWNGSVPWVSAKDIKRLFLDDTQDHITEAAAENGAKQLPGGTVLMLTRGMTLLRARPTTNLAATGRYAMLRDMRRTSYSTDLTDAQWRRIAPWVLAPKPGGRPAAGGLAPSRKDVSGAAKAARWCASLACGRRACGIARAC